MRFLDDLSASVKADDLLKELAQGAELTAEQHAQAAVDLLRHADMIATAPSRSDAKVHMLSALARTHAAVAQTLHIIDLAR